jgi:hypothetical protein
LDNDDDEDDDVDDGKGKPFIGDVVVNPVRSIASLEQYVVPITDLGVLWYNV